MAIKAHLTPFYSSPFLISQSAHNFIAKIRFVSSCLLMCRAPRTFIAWDFIFILFLTFAWTTFKRMEKRRKQIKNKRSSCVAACCMPRTNMKSDTFDPTTSNPDAWRRLSASWPRTLSTCFRSCVHLNEKDEHIALFATGKTTSSVLPADDFISFLLKKIQNFMVSDILRNESWAEKAQRGYSDVDKVLIVTFFLFCPFPAWRWHCRCRFLIHCAHTVCKTNKRKKLLYAFDTFEATIPCVSRIYNRHIETSTQYLGKSFFWFRIWTMHNLQTGQDNRRRSIFPSSHNLRMLSAHVRFHLRACAWAMHM